MKLTFLGTGTSQGVPVIACKCKVCRSENPKDKRLRTALMIETQGKTLVVDSGPDFRQQMLREKVQKLDAVILTHEHKDHIAGLDDVRAFNYQAQKPMDVYAEPRVQQALRREFAYAFANYKYPGVPEITLHTIEENSSEIEGINIVPIRVFHYKLPILGYRIGNMAYITDANFIPEQEKKKLKDLDVLIVNALRKRKHISHYNLAQACKLVEELKPQQAYFTHISHLMGLHTEVQSELPDNIMLAYDGLQLEV